MKANDLKPGNAIKLDGKLLVCMKIDHTKPGKGPAYIQAKLKDVKGGGYIDKRFGSSDTIEGTSVDRQTCEFLYDDGTGFVFMDAETFDQFTINRELAEDSMLYLRPNAQCTVLFHEDNPIGIDLPGSVELQVTDCEPGVKSATVTNVMKEAVMETGLKVRVPDFIEVGENLRVNTSDSSYLGRAKD